MLSLIIKLLACVLVAMLTETTNIWSYVAPSNKIPNSNDLESSTVFLFSPSFLRSPFFSSPQQNSVFVSWKWTWKQCWGEEHTFIQHTDTHTGWGRPYKPWESPQSCTMISSHLFLRRTILSFVLLYVGNRDKQKDRPIHCILFTMVSIAK